jgi:rare lipoprotein A
MTANGEIYDMYDLTAAHKTLPFDTLVEVENLDNGLRVEVRINDRGPFVRGRVIDLTYTAAEQIAMIGPGVARVRVRVVGQTDLEGRRFVVQVGAFSDPATARTLEEVLGPYYAKVRIESDAGIHRVLIGSFKKQRKAEKVAADLRAAGYDTFVRTAPPG